MDMMMQPLHQTSDLMTAPLCEQDYAPFDPMEYLREYYAQLGEENRELLTFFTRAYTQIFRKLTKASVLEFGGGPTIYQLISAAKYPVSIDFSDFLTDNLHELTKWLDDRPEQFPWDAFIAYTLEREGKTSNPAAIQKRAQLIRRKVKRFLHCDVRRPDPLGPEYRSGYDVVSANFVLEAITEERALWDRFLDHVLPLVRSDGYLVLCTVVDATKYRVGERYYPATPITLELLVKTLQHKGMAIELTHTVRAEQPERHGYTGIAMVLARKTRMWG
jgi:hypothetical protein